MHPTVKDWLKMSREELDQVYVDSTPGPIPTGPTRGTPIVAGSPLAKTFAWLARLFAWQGKVFDIYGPDTGILLNKVTLFRISFIIAKVYRGTSWMDEKETIVIDYSKTSFLFRKIRDEIREVETGVYLGKVWWGKTRILDFALTVKDQSAG